MFRSILVVLAGWAAVGVLVVCTDGLFNYLYPDEIAHGKTPPDWFSLTSLGASTLYSVVGGWITARLAKDNLWKHIWGLAGWGEMLGIATALATWGRIQPWYSIGLCVVWIPAVMLGGWIRARQLS